jgi:O-acetyl-ADP-ribose deacetylase (regulator of RNase III)
MIDYTTGDILKDEAEALVNTVNTVGVMGKGIALQFKRQFPRNFDAYLKACKTGEVEPGKVFVWHTGRLGNPKYIINFPTKRHWKGKSHIDDIEAGLRDLQRVIAELRIQSIAVPPLGCGNGGLQWSAVRPIIHRYLGAIDGVKVTVYEPSGSPAPATMPANPKTPRMTIHRAAMLASFSRYLQPGFSLGRLEAQKLIYFLQAAGAPFERLKFAKGPYGPYSDGIRHVLNQVEGHFIRGFGDADTASKIELLEEPVHRAESMLEEPENVVFQEAVEAVASFTSGFDDAFGLELLASVHWVAAHGEPPARNASEAVSELHEWSERKRRRYNAAQVRSAWSRLEDAGLVATTIQDETPAPQRKNAPLSVPDVDLVTSSL